MTKGSAALDGALGGPQPDGQPVAFVTGAASGIGRALAVLLGARGACVIVADRQGQLAQEVVAEVEACGGQAQVAELDVRHASAFEAALRETRRERGRIDYLFNNAGVAIGGEARHYSLADWNDVLDVNLRGTVHGVQAVYSVMREQGFGHIVNTASIAGLIPADAVAYCASKHAVVGLSKALRAEAARYGVRVSVLCPGLVRTPLLTGGKFGRLNLPGVELDRIHAAWERRPLLEPEVFAQRALAQVLRNRLYIVVPGWCKAFWYLERIWPSLSVRFWAWQTAQLRSELGL